MYQGTGDGEPQPNATGFDIARLIEPHEWLEHIFQPFRIYARPLIADPDQQLTLGALQRYLGTAGVLDGIADEVLQHPPQGIGAAGIDLISLPKTSPRLPGIGIIVT